MIKRITLCIMLGLLLSLTLGMAQAKPVDELSDLSAYYPEDSPLFISIRTDAAFIETLNGLLALIQENTGGAFPPPDLNINALLDQLALTLTGLPYETSIGPWLGDTIAIGFNSTAFITSDMNDPTELGLVLAFANTDTEAAALFAAGATETDTPTEADGYSLYAGQVVYAALNDDVLLIGFSQDDIEQAINPENPLSNNEAFINTLNALPNESYNIISYTNTGSINRANIENLNQALGFDVSSVLVQSLLTDSEATNVIGFSIIDGRSLSIDSATVLSEEALQASLQRLGDLQQNPVSLDFAAFIPAYAQLVIHDNGFGPDTLTLFRLLNNLGPVLQNVLDTIAQDEALLNELSFRLSQEILFSRQLRQFWRMLTFQQQAMLLDQLTPENLAEQIDILDLSVINFGGLLLNQISTIFAGFTGLNLQNEVLNWMTGDYANYVALIPVEGDLVFSFDAGFLTSTTDSAAAANTLDKLERAAQLYGLGHSTEDIDGADQTLVILPLLRAPLSFGLPPELLTETPELDFVMAYNDDVYFVGSRPGAEFALGNGAESLLDQAAFQYAAQNLFLEDTVTVWYLATQPLIDVLPVLGPFASAQQLQQVAFVLAQVESMTITSSTPTQETTLLRMTLTIPQEVSIAMPQGGSGMASPPITVPATPVAPDEEPLIPAATEES